MFDFRTVLITLLPFVDGEDLVQATDSIIALPLPQPSQPVVTNPQGGTLDWERNGVTPYCWNYDQNTLVGIALHTPTVLEHARTKKILAIKELRDVAKCGLTAAKNAVEDFRVFSAAPLDPPPF